MKRAIALPKLDQERARSLARFKRWARELAKPLPVERAAKIELDLSMLEDYARRTGLFNEKESLEFRLYRFVSRWRLGEALTKIERGKRGPKGKNSFSPEKQFVALLNKIKVATRQAQEAQRIACIPLPELHEFCNAARKEGDPPTFDELLIFARPYWYKASRQRRHQAIRDNAPVARETLQPGQFPLIYADPPTKFSTYSEKGLERTPDQHYPTLTWDEVRDFKIDGLTVDELAHDDAALLLWCTSSNMHLALEVMKAWGFTFKSSAVWVKTDEGKPISGLGLVFRNQHEVLLYGTKGNMPGPQYQPPSVFMYPRGEHSAKPPEIRKEIEKMYPDFDASTRLELFARNTETIEGWTCRGFESDSDA